MTLLNVQLALPEDHFSNAASSSSSVIVVNILSQHLKVCLAEVSAFVFDKPKRRIENLTSSWNFTVVTYSIEEKR